MSAEQIEIHLAAVEGSVRVAGLVGREDLNALYHFDLQVIADPDETFVRRVVATPATVLLNAGEPRRAVHGIVTACTATGRDAAGMATFALRIEPRLARLSKRKASRIFQDMTAREIVQHVLALSRIQHRWQIHRDLPKRIYCTQYDETDYAFVTRVCASEGIFFSFEHPIGPAAPLEEILVLSDSAGTYEPIDGGLDLRFRPAAAATSALTIDEDHVFELVLRHAMRAGRVLLRSFDLEKPPIPQRDAAGTDGVLPVEDLESMRSFVDSGLTIYEHQQSREQALLRPVPATIALEAETADETLAEGETACRRLIPGRRFRLQDHVSPELDGEYAVVACSHEAFSPQGAPVDQPLYRNRFTAVPASVPFRPPRPARAVRQTLETATVVGPPGQEVHTDELGRVKVQFHWDLQGKLTDRSSCWLRVVQPWAGSGYGAQFLPRVGAEVLVGYIDGDTDRPVVMGCLYNGLNHLPHSFPRDHERSGIKTRSIPGGKGGHELLFDDRAGAELVSMRSSRTMDLSAAENMAVRAEGELRITTGGSREEDVREDASTTIGGAESRRVGGSRRQAVGGDDALEVRGDQESTVHGDEVRRVEGLALHIFDGSRATVIGARAGAEANEQVGVSGEYRVSSVQEMTLQSKTKVQIVCGSSKITLLPDSVLIESPAIQLQATERIILAQGDPPEATVVLQGSVSIAGGTVVAKGGGEGGGKLVLDAEAHLDGSHVKLSCGSGGGAGASRVRSEDLKDKVRFTVRPEGLPAGVEAVTLVIATPSGDLIERECAVGGSVELEGKEGDVFTVVETRVGDRPAQVRKKTQGPEGR